MANFCCPIEMEPKTLNEGQLNHAREVAVDIVLNKETYEATQIFVEGLKPISKGNITVVNKIEECNKEMIKNETACQCSFTSSIIDSPADNPKHKEPLSAPF